MSTITRSVFRQFLNCVGFFAEIPLIWGWFVYNAILLSDGEAAVSREQLNASETYLFVALLVGILGPCLLIWQWASRITGVVDLFLDGGLDLVDRSGRSNLDG